MAKEANIRRGALIAAAAAVIALAWWFWPARQPQWRQEQTAAGKWADSIGVGKSAGGVREISLADLGTTDRCITCHVNADRPEFGRREEIVWLEGQGASAPGFWEKWAAKISPGSIATARQMRRPLMDQVLEDVPAETGRMLAEQYRVGLIADRAAKGMGRLDPSPVLLGHPRIVGKHTWAVVGCTGCHEGNGEATEFVAAAHAARKMWVDATTGSPVLDAEMASGTSEDVEMQGSAAYTDPVTGNMGEAISQRDYWDKTYPAADGTTLSSVYTNWPRPMLRLSHVEADCVRCHAQMYDIQPAAPVICEGRRLFATMGCVDCHATGQIAARKVGPDLRHIDVKLSKEAVVEWLLHPRGGMPAMGMSGEEARTIADYLFGHTDKVELLAAPSGVVGDAERGKVLFFGHHLDDPQALARHVPLGMKAGLGCVACHAVENEGEATFGPNLAEVSIPSKEWLFTWLKDPKRCDGDALMPNMRLSDQEAADLEAFLLKQKKEASIAGAPASARGGESADAGALISHYGCINCHAIDGVAPLTDVNLAERMVLREPATGHGPGREDRVTEILRHPDTTPLPLRKLQMPRFDLNSEQVNALVTFILSDRPSLVSDRLRGAAGDDLSTNIARGREIAEFYNCVGCHQTELNRPEVRKYFSYAWIGNYAPPPLYGEGSRVQAEWLGGFLRNVMPIRPQLKMRMPSFGWREGEVGEMVEYFQATGQKESRELTEESRDREALTQWALARGEVRAVELNPALNTPAELDRTMQNILYKAHFVAEVQGRKTLGWPANGAVSAERYQMGARFVTTLQCYQCHSIGVDKPDAKAPNYSMAARRLNRDWVRAWLQESTILQPDTAMPPVFTGLPVLDPGGQVCSRAMGMKDPQLIAETEEFGKTVKEQSDLLIDFLYAAGSK